MADMENANKLILGIVIISVTLIIAIYIVSTLETSFEVPNTSGSAVNETVTGLTNTTGVGDYLSANSLKDAACSVSIVKNATSGATVPATNYTMTNCLIKAVSNSYYVGQNVKVTYTYTYTASTNASVAAGDVTTSLDSGTPWITIIVVVGFAVMVLGFLTSGFKGAAEKAGAPTY